MVVRSIERFPECMGPIVLLCGIFTDKRLTFEGLPVKKKLEFRLCCTLEFIVIQIFNFCGVIVVDYTSMQWAIGPASYSKGHCFGFDRMYHNIHLTFTVDHGYRLRYQTAIH